MLNQLNKVHIEHETEVSRNKYSKFNFNFK